MKEWLQWRCDYELIMALTSAEIQSKHWGGNINLSMEGLAIEYFPNSVDPGSN